MFSKWVLDRIFYSSSWLVFFAVVAVMCSQVFQVIAFLLPLKVILLLGSSTVPEYFPDFLLGVEWESLVLALGVGSIIIFFIYIVFDLVGSKLIGVISDRLVVEGGSTCFKGLPSRSYLASTKDFVVVVSGCFFTILVLLVLGFLDFSILSFVLGYLSFSVSCLVILAGGFSRLRAYALDMPDRVFEFFGASGFFFVFLVLVVDFLYLGKSSILLSVVVLLLCRQMFSRLVLAIKSWRRFSIRGADGFPARQMDASSRTLINSVSAMSDVAVYFERANVEEMLRDSLRSVGLSDCGIGLRLIFTSSDELRLCVCCSSDGQPSWLLFRLVVGKSVRLAKKSYEISRIYKSPAFLDVIFQSEENGVYAQLYNISGEAESVVDRGSIHSARRFGFRESCFLPPAKDLKGILGKPSLVDRMQLSFWSDCRSRAEWMGDGSAEIIDELISSECLFERVKSLPLCVHNPNNLPSNFLSISGEFKFLDWGQCYLESLGASWPYEFGYEELKKDFLSVCSDRPELEVYSLQDVWLVSILYHFERLCVKGKYLEAFKLLPDIRVIVSEFSN